MPCWRGVRPGDSDPHPIWLPPTGALDEDEVYIPAGWFHAGSRDADAYYVRTVLPRLARPSLRS